MMWIQTRVVICDLLLSFGVQWDCTESLLVKEEHVGENDFLSTINCYYWKKKAVAVWNSHRILICLVRIEMNKSAKMMTQRKGTLLYNSDWGVVSVRVTATKHLQCSKSYKHEIWNVIPSCLLQNILDDAHKLLVAMPRELRWSGSASFLWRKMPSH